MRKLDIHQVRTFFFQPGETITLKSVLRSKNSSARFRVRPGNHAVETSTEKVVFKMPRAGLGIQTAELDVSFTGRWNKLHLDRVGIDVLVRGSKGVRHIHHVIPGPKIGRWIGRWIYRMVSVRPGSTRYFCPESNCENRMLPVTDQRACPACSGVRMIPLEVPE